MYGNSKVILVKTILGMVEGEVKENDGGGEFKYGILAIV
jgi:hypothetical protein